LIFEDYFVALESVVVVFHILTPPELHTSSWSTAGTVVLTKELTNTSFHTSNENLYFLVLLV